MSKKELAEASLEELEQKLHEFRAALFQLRNEKVANKKLEKPSELNKIRKNIARTLTFMNAKRRQSV